MLIIKSTPEENGAYANQLISGEFPPPDGWLCVPDELEAKAVSCLPFALITIKDGVITDIADNPAKPELPPLPPDIISELQKAVDLLLVAVLEE